MQILIYLLTSLSFVIINVAHKNQTSESYIKPGINGISHMYLNIELTNIITMQRCIFFRKNTIWKRSTVCVQRKHIYFYN